MVDRAGEIEIAVTDTETQALLLEANLISATHQPRYNVRLKDDKSYPMVQLTAHDAPRIEITRDPDESATVFGPYTSKTQVETVVKALRETYGVRGCSDHKVRGPRAAVSGLRDGTLYRALHSRDRPRELRARRHRRRALPRGRDRNPHGSAPAGDGSRRGIAELRARSEPAGPTRDRRGLPRRGRRGGSVDW